MVRGMLCHVPESLTLAHLASVGFGAPEGLENTQKERDNPSRGQTKFGGCNLRKYWGFLKDKSNREVITWAVGSCAAVVGAGASVLNYLAPNDPPPAALPNKPVVASTPSAGSKCPDLSKVTLRPSGFVIEGSNERAIKLEEIVSLSKCELWIARNEIYARKGRLFANPALQAHFRGQDWYKPAQDVGNLTEIEAKNVHTIRVMESR